jgi:hypothetical protein
MHRYAAALVFLYGLFLAVPLATAQSHTASGSAIDAALQAHVDATDSDRDAVLRLLERDEIRSVARTAGIDLRTMADAVKTMSAADLAKVAAQVNQVETALAGGQSRIVISSTVIIIALLVLILIIVAVD